MAWDSSADKVIHPKLKVILVVYFLGNNPLRLAACQVNTEVRVYYFYFLGMNSKKKKKYNNVEINTVGRKNILIIASELIFNSTVYFIITRSDSNNLIIIYLSQLDL